MSCIFQPTHPQGVRLRATSICVIGCFNSRTHKGCDPTSLLRFSEIMRFNSRTREGCDSVSPICVIFRRLTLIFCEDTKYFELTKSIFPSLNPIIWLPAHAKNDCFLHCIRFAPPQPLAAVRLSNRLQSYMTHAPLYVQLSLHNFSQVGRF